MCNISWPKLAEINPNANLLSNMYWLSHIAWATLSKQVKAFPVPFQSAIGDVLQMHTSGNGS